MERKEKVKKRMTRRRRVRSKVVGTSERPRLSVFRSNKYITLQLIDDDKGETLLQISDLNLNKKKKRTKTEMAYEVGEKIAEDAKKKKIKKAVFDKGGYAYRGRVKAASEGARKGGLII